MKHFSYEIHTHTCSLLFLLTNYTFLSVRINFHSYVSNTFGRTPWMGDRSVSRPLTTHNNNDERQIHIHSQNDNWTHDPNVWTFEPSTRLTLRGHCDHYDLFRPLNHRFEVRLLVMKCIYLDMISKQIEGIYPWNNHGNQKRSHQATDFSDTDTTRVSIAICWDVTSCSLVVNRWDTGTYFLQTGYW
jgi:hypothetical protein